MRLAVLGLTLFATVTFADVPTTNLISLEFRPDAVVFGCAKPGEQLIRLRSDARGESGTFGLSQLERPETGPLTTTLPKRSRKGPAGESLEIELVQSKGTWTDDRFSWSVNAGRTGVPTSNARLYLVKGTTRRLLTGFMAIGVRGTMTPYWSPDGGRVALGLESFDGDADKAGGCLVWAPTGPSIEFSSSIAAFTKTRADVLRTVGIEERIIGQLRAAGFAVAHFSTPKKEREKSVLFVPAGFPDDQLARLKEAFGEVTVEPLTWAAKGDVLLVLGNELFK